jgi:hypothetical protein
MTNIPGSRVILTNFMGFFIHLDRLQFYYFHSRHYSQYNTVLLAGINIPNDLKGLLSLSILQQANPDISSNIDSYYY